MINNKHNTDKTSTFVFPLVPFGLKGEERKIRRTTTTKRKKTTTKLKELNLCHRYFLSTPTQKKERKKERKTEKETRNRCRYKMDHLCQLPSNPVIDTPVFRSRGPLLINNRPGACSDWRRQRENYCFYFPQRQLLFASYSSDNSSLPFKPLRYLDLPSPLFFFLSLFLKRHSQAKGRE